MTKQEAETAVSPAILEAQARLLALRSRLIHTAAPKNGHEERDPASIPWQDHRPTSSSQPAAAQSSLLEIGDLPEHLGWGSQPLTHHIKTVLNSRRQISERENSPEEETVSSVPPTLSTEPVNYHSSPSGSPDLTAAPQSSSITAEEIENGSIKLYPDIGLGILREKMAAPARIWLLLRWIDQPGSGKIEIENARSLLCAEDSELRICGWRQLRSLLAQGEGRFWQRRQGKIWLRSIPKVAQALHVPRLTGHPVELELGALTSGIGKFRAHLYASFHSGRRHAKPISRTSLTKISQVSRRSQQNYEKEAQVRKQKNFAIGLDLKNDQAKEQGWRQGSASFTWHDHQGIFGAQKQTRLAWQLPNSYQGPHAQRPRGRQKQFNRELAVLSTKGMTGNGSSKVEFLPQRYFDGASKAIRHLSQKSISGGYWRGKQPGHWFYVQDPDQL